MLVCFSKKTAVPGYALYRYTLKTYKTVLLEKKQPLRERPHVTQDLYVLENIRQCFEKNPAGAPTSNKGLVYTQEENKNPLRERPRVTSTGLVYTQNYKTVF